MLDDSSIVNTTGYFPLNPTSKAEKLRIPACEAVVNGYGSGRNESENGGLIAAIKKVAYRIDRSLSSCQLFYTEPTVQELMRSGRKFDLFLTFSAYYDICALGLAAHLGIDNAVLHVPAPYMFPLHVSRLGLPLYSSSVAVGDILVQGKDWRVVWTILARVFPVNYNLYC